MKPTGVIAVQKASPDDDDDDDYDDDIDDVDDGGDGDNDEDAAAYDADVNDNGLPNATLRTHCLKYVQSCLSTSPLILTHRPLSSNV